MRNFCLDIRFQMVIDNILASHENPDSEYPDIQMQMLFGGLFNEKDTS